MKNIARYQYVNCPSADNGYVIGVYNQKTGTCERVDWGFDEVDELNKLWDRNQTLERSVKRLKRNLKALTALSLDYQKRAIGCPSSSMETKP